LQADGGLARAWHVTDDPERVLQAIADKVLLVSPRDEGKWGEIGPGLYASAAPRYWAGRAGNKWGFLDRLTDGQRHHLVDKLAEEPDFEKPGYLSRSEIDRADQILVGVYTGQRDAHQLVQLAEQPYNITFWRPSYLETLDIEPGRQPQVIELTFRGMFAELGCAWMNEITLEELLQRGYAGTYTRSGFSTSPQVVIYDTHAIVEARIVPMKFGGQL